MKDLMFWITCVMALCSMAMNIAGVISVRKEGRDSRDNAAFGFLIIMFVYFVFTAIALS